MRLYMYYRKALLKMNWLLFRNKIKVVTLVKNQNKVLKNSCLHMILSKILFS